MPCSTAKLTWDLLVWGDEAPQNDAQAIATVKAILRIARVETGAVSSILAVKKNPQVVCDVNGGNDKSLKRRFLHSNAGIVQDCLRTRSVVASREIMLRPLFDQSPASSPTWFRTVAVPVIHENSLSGCMLLIFAKSSRFTTLHPGLKDSLLHLGAAIAMLLENTQSNMHGVAPPSRKSTPFAPPFPGRLSELKSVLQNGSASWEHIGQQLSSYLQGPFAATTADCDRSGGPGGAANDSGGQLGTTKLAHP